MNGHHSIRSATDKLSPFFEQWPPTLNLKGDQMDGRKNLVWTEAIPPWLVLTILFLVGLALTALPKHWHEYAMAIVHLLGEAFIVAALLGMTIDGWFKQELAKNVFYAAMGEFVRPEFKREVRRMATFKWLCVRSDCHLVMKDLGDGVVELTITVERDIQNISTSKEKFSGYFGVDQWGFPERPSRVELCELVFDGNSVKPTEPVSRIDHLSISTEEISVPAGEIVKAIYRGVEHRRINDHWIFAVRTPTINPSVFVDKPDSIEAGVTFSARDELRLLPQLKKTTLDGVLFPGQVQIVRWWPKETISSSE